MYKFLSPYRSTLTVGLMIIVAIIVLLGVMPSAHETQGVFYSPILWLFIVLMAIFSALGAILQFRRGFFFVILHLSVLVIVIGVLLGYFLGVRETIRVPYDRFNTEFSGQFVKAGLHQTMGENSQNLVLKLPFEMRIRKFFVEKYPPKYYILYQAQQNELGYSYEAIAKLEPKEEFLPNENESFMCVDLSSVKNMPNELKEEKIPVAGKRGGSQWMWAFDIPLGEGFQLRAAEQAIKRYETEVEIKGEDQTYKVLVNSPLFYKEWILYLMDYDRQRGAWVVLSVRKDPGRIFVIGGIWGIILATCGTCFIRKKKEGEEK